MWPDASPDISVPTANSAANTDMADVIGNKTDTATGNSIVSYTKKIDDLATDGLLGTVNSLSYRVHEIEKHLHNREIWVGNGATEDSLTPYTLVSGNNDFGSEVLLLDVGDTPFQAGYVSYDPHMIEVVSVDTASTYLIRLIWGTGTVGAAETAKQYTTDPITPTGIGSNVSGAPIAIMSPRVAAGTKLWAKCKNATNLAEVEILLGIHEYEG